MSELHPVKPDLADRLVSPRRRFFERRRRPEDRDAMPDGLPGTGWRISASGKTQ